MVGDDSDRHGYCYCALPGTRMTRKDGVSGMMVSVVETSTADWGLYWNPLQAIADEHDHPWDQV